MINIYDGIHTWHVAKTGNNNNGGHSLADAKLTIGAAVSAAGAGDMIIVWPGDYDEHVDLDSANKSLIIAGTNRNKCRVVRSSNAAAITLISGCELRNISAISVNSQDMNCKAVVLKNGSSEILVDNCFIHGSYDGLYGVGTSAVLISNSHLKGQYDSVNATAINGWTAVNCIFETDGTFTNVDTRAAIVGGQAVFNNCIFLANRSISNSTKYLAAVKIEANQKSPIAFNNCSFKAVGSGSFTGTVYGINAQGSDTKISIQGGSIYTSGQGATILDIFMWFYAQADLCGCSYDKNKLENEFEYGGQHYDGVIKEYPKNPNYTAEYTAPDNTNISLIRKILKNKAVQNKSTGVIVFYDDDGVAPILTISPTETDSQITRIPS